MLPWVECVSYRCLIDGLIHPDSSSSMLFPKNTRLALLLVLFLAPFSSLFATHLSGGTIGWNCQSSGEVVFTLEVYQDCRDTTLLGSIQTLRVSGHPAMSTISLTLSTQTDMSPTCSPSNGSGPTCANRDAGSVERFLYVSAPINLGTVPPGLQGWAFTWDSCCRDNTATSILTPSTTGITLRAVMYAPNGEPMFPCFDSSPAFSANPVTTVCLSLDKTLSNIASDRDRDSLAFSLAPAYEDFHGTFNPGTNPDEVDY